MDKFDFITQLRAKLWAIPEEDRQRSVDFYAEMIAERMEDGLSEEEAVAAVGDLDEIVKSILAETPVRPAEPAKKPLRRLRWWEITLLILGFPVWGSLVIAVAAVIFSAWVSLWAGVICLYATAFALGASSLGCLVGSVFMFDSGFAAVLVALGAALMCAGLGILLFILSNLAAKGMIALTKLMGKGIHKIFGRKEQAV